ncbi:MAG: PrsW family intramembrane metalloprotease [Clostridiales bacterium]|nr:PrsW family intramembrane metalloprotease [Clostridiales bacterium]
MAFALALIPVIGLLVFIYFKDKKEKEPVGFLVALFFAGMGSIITAIIAEALGELILNVVIPSESAIKQVLVAMIIVGPAEEIGKYLVLRLITWKSRHFDYSYDAIVYAVFVSLGFAALENVVYVFGKGGLGTALMRMFTAVPGHACFAVFMGFFYSKAKHASLTNKKGKSAGFKALAMLVPIILHGIYDAILMGAGATDEDLIAGVSLLFWIVYVIALFVASFIIVIISSKHDFCIVNLPDKVQTIYRPQVAGNWTCSCGSVNYLNFCPKCGKHRQTGAAWYCPKCGTLSTYNFCGNCGCQKPEPRVPSAVQV